MYNNYRRRATAYRKYIPERKIGGLRWRWRVEGGKKLKIPIAA